MIRFGEKAAFLAVIVAVTGIMLLDTVGMRDDSSLVPRVMGWPLLVLASLALLAEVFPTIAARVGASLPAAFRGYLQPGVGGAAEGAQVMAVDPHLNDRATLYRCTAWLAAIIALTYVIGLMWAAAVGMFVWIKFVVRSGWLVSLAMAAGTVVFIYGAFVLGFDYEYFLRPVMQ